jgi:tetratricopeptide (TPR) repeat protein
MSIIKTRVIEAVTLAVLLLAVMSCSSHKNTAKSRFWQSFTARYNTYYNGTLAYIDGALAKEEGNKDNHMEIIPLYTVGNKNSRSLGSGNFDKAIEKSQKAIKLHSINKRPEWTKSRRKTAKDIEWLNRREYNPMMWKAWMLMGRSQFHKGSFDEAAATFSYMSRLYQTQPAIYGKARAWLAKCYIEQEWRYDAEDVIRNMERDSIDWHAQKEWNYTYADYYIHTKEYEKAIPYLRKVIKQEMRRKQRAREWFLMGQLESALGHREKAYAAYRKVLKQNPPYELAFNARIAMTEVLAENQTKKTISRLKRMAASDNNKDYLDQVYYAMGNVYMLEKDTANAIIAYEKGNEQSTRNGVEKGVLLLRLGDLYWTKEKFGDAQRCYGEAIGLLDKERKDYEELSRRSKILDELAPFTEDIHLQDSLLALSEMPEKERLEAIDRVIEELKKKEKEERKKQLEAMSQETQARNNAVGSRNRPNANQQQLPQQQKGEWYFYNQLAVSQGKNTFQQQWGKRENADNWQRSNKTVVSDLFSENQESTTAMADSLGNTMEAVEDSVSKETNDSAQNDPHKREYYLKQIPFTDEQKQECHAIISDALFHSGVIFKDKLDNLRLSEKQFNRLTYNYPDFEQMDEVYYHLFLLYSRKEDSMTADSYVAQLKEKFPESKWTILLTDPYYVENSKWGEHLEDSLYAATYAAFKAERYQEVMSNAQVSETRFPLGANRDKFIFIRGLSRLNANDADGCVADMTDVVKNYPSSRISEMAGMIVNGVKAGKRLHGGKFDLEDVWSRRAAVLNDSDSIAARQFTDDRNKEFLYILAYHPDSLNENQLLFEMARFNFTTFIVRNFDIQIEDADGIHLMMVSGFRNFDEAHQYASEVYSHENIVRRMKKARVILISRDNVELLGKQYSYDDYDDFYSKHFAPLKVSSDNLLSEPMDIGEEREPDTKPTRRVDGNRTGQDAPNDDDGFGFEDEGSKTESEDTGFDIPSEETTPRQETPTGTEIPDTPVTPVPTTPPDNNPPANDDDGFTIPDDNTGSGNTPAIDDDGFTIPDDNTGNGKTPAIDDDGFTIPDDNTGNSKTPANDDDGFTIPDDNTGNGNTPANDDNEFNFLKKQDDRKGQKTGSMIKRQPDLPQVINHPAATQTEIQLPTRGTSQPSQNAKTEKAENKKGKPSPTQRDLSKKKELPEDIPTIQLDEEGISFDDDNAGTPSTSKTKSKKKEKELEEIDLEDEYYDLEGF